MAKKKEEGASPVQEEAFGQEKTPTLEEAFLMLDEITRSLEDENITLENAFQEYKKGMDLLKICNEQIDKVEKQVLVLNEEGGLDEF